jgi:hypothetical protein
MLLATAALIVAGLTLLWVLVNTPPAKPSPRPPKPKRLPIPPPPRVDNCDFTTAKRRMRDYERRLRELDGKDS